MSSSDSASAEESSEHSGKVRRLLLLDIEEGGEGREEAKAQMVSEHWETNVHLSFLLFYSEFMDFEMIVSGVFSFF